MTQTLHIESKALNRYRDLIEQGQSPSSAQAHVQIEYGIRLSQTWMALAERGPLTAETW